MTELFGGVLWALFLLLLSWRLAAEEKRVLGELTGLCLLLDALRAELSGAPRPLPALFATFSNPALEGCGFLSILRQKGLAAALGSGALHKRTAGVALPILLPFAEALGTRLLAEESRAVSEALAHLSAVAKSTAEEVPRRVRLGGVLTVSGGMLILLLLI